MERAAVASRLRELAFLNAGVEVAIRGDHSHDATRRHTEPEGREVFLFEGGIAQYVGWLTREAAPLTEVLAFQRTVDGVEVAAAVRWAADSYGENLLGYANSIRTVDGGTHLDGLKAALTRSVNALARKCGAALREWRGRCARGGALSRRRRARRAGTST